MAASFLTGATTMMCPHGGTVQSISANARVTAGDPILRGSDTFVIAGCPFAIGPALHPCVTIHWVQTAQRCTIQDPVLTQASIGLCQAADQAVQGPVQIVATQARAGGL